MKRILSLFTIVVLLMLVLPSGASAVADNGTGHYWLFSGLNQTGQYRDFNIGPSQSVNLGTLNYQQNCGGSCIPMYHTVSSVAFSCGTTGTRVKAGDYITIYITYPNIGSSQRFTSTYPTGCSGGLMRFNLNSTMNDHSAGVVTHFN